MKKINLKEPVPSSKEPYQAGKFAARAETIKKSFDKVGEQLESVSKELQQRLKSITTTLETVQNGYSKMEKVQQPAGGKRGPGRPSAATARAKATSPETSNGALGAVRKHLDKP